MDLDLRELDKGFRGMKAAGKNLNPVWKVLRGRMTDDQLEHWENQEGLKGGWKPRAESTRRRWGRRKKVFGKRFAKAFSVLSTKLELAAISKIEYASAHQFGETVGQGAKLPERPFLYLSEAFIDFALPRIQKHLGKGWSRGR